MKRIIFAIETTGLDPYRDEILSLTMLDESGLVMLDRMFKPTHTWSWPQDEGRHGISPEDVKQRPPISQSMDEIQRLIDEAHEVVVYGAEENVAFLRQAGVTVDDKKVQDTMLAFAEEQGEWDERRNCLREPSLDDAAEAAGYKWPGGIRGSMGNAMATLTVQRWLESRPDARRPWILTRGNTPIRKRNSALWLCLFLGLLGIHRFYLGRPVWEGFVYLVASLLALGGVIPLLVYLVFVAAWIFDLVCLFRMRGAPKGKGKGADEGDKGKDAAE